MANEIFTLAPTAAGLLIGGSFGSIYGAHVAGRMLDRGYTHAQAETVKLLFQNGGGYKTQNGQNGLKRVMGTGYELQNSGRRLTLIRIGEGQNGDCEAAKRGLLPFSRSEATIRKPVAVLGLRAGGS
jgi:hypothetical protein